MFTVFLYCLALTIVYPSLFSSGQMVPVSLYELVNYRYLSMVLFGLPCSPLWILPLWQLNWGAGPYTPSSTPHVGCGGLSAADRDAPLPPVLHPCYLCICHRGCMGDPRPSCCSSIHSNVCVKQAFPHRLKTQQTLKEMSCILCNDPKGVHLIDLLVFHVFGHSWTLGDFHGDFLPFSISGRGGVFVFLVGLWSASSWLWPFFVVSALNKCMQNRNIIFFRSSV